MSNHAHIWAFVTSISHMGEMRDSDWSRENLLRSDWSGLIGASITTSSNFERSVTARGPIKLEVLKGLAFCFLLFCMITVLQLAVSLNITISSETLTFYT